MLIERAGVLESGVVRHKVTGVPPDRGVLIPLTAAPAAVRRAVDRAGRAVAAPVVWRPRSRTVGARSRIRLPRVREPHHQYLEWSPSWECREYERMPLIPCPVAPIERAAGCSDLGCLGSSVIHLRLQVWIPSDRDL